MSRKRKPKSTANFHPEFMTAVYVLQSGWGYATRPMRKANDTPAGHKALVDIGWEEERGLLVTPKEYL